MKTHRYSLWEWTRAYLVLALWLPFFPIMALLDGRTMPKWLTRKLLLSHITYTVDHKMDFRIPPDESVPAYMQRWWRVPRNWATNVYYHIVLRSDDDRALHDHPWWSFSIVLDGGYFEHTIREGGVHNKEWFGPGRLRFRWHGKKAHRLELPQKQWIDDPEGGPGERPARTIFITGPVLRRWGFHHESGWVDAYQWDAFCAQRGIKNSMRMDGGSDGAISARNHHSVNKDQ